MGLLCWKICSEGVGMVGFVCGQCLCFLGLEALGEWGGTSQAIHW
jgi:hypothetical protein